MWRRKNRNPGHGSYGVRLSFERRGDGADGWRFARDSQRYLPIRRLSPDESAEGCDYIAYDNLPIKGYAYPREEIEAIHDLGQKIKTIEGEAAICPECGYVMLEVGDSGE